MTQSNDKQLPPDRIDISIEQVGRLTEVVTTGFSEIKEGLAEVKATTERQAETVRHLVGIVGTLIRNQQGR